MRFTPSLRGIAAALVIAAASVSLAVTGAAPAHANTSTFTGPLTPGFSADPDITYYNGNYYELYNQNLNNTITVRKAPSIALLASAPNTTVYTADDQTKGYIGWGGFFFHYQSHWYIYDNEFTDNPDRAFVLQSSGDDPIGPYSFVAQLAGPGPGDLSYVNNVFVNNGQLYSIQTADSPSGHGIYLATMSNPWTVSSAFTLIADPTGSWEGGIDEGGSIKIRNNKIFLIFSAGSYLTAGYCVGLLTASVSSNLSIATSWTKSPGCVFGSNPSAGVWGPGSMTWFTSPDGTQDWVAYHGKVSGANTGGQDRQVTAKQVTWDANNNPSFGSPIAFGAPIALPSGDPGAPTGVGDIGALPGGLTNISAASDGTVVGVAPDNAVWRYTGSGSLPWSQITGKSLTRVAVRSANDIWGIASDQSIWRYTGSWARIAGGAFDIATGADGSVWATASGGTYRWSGGTSATTWQSNWTLVPGSAPGGVNLVKQVSGKSATDLWGVDGSAHIWHFNGASWTQVSGGLNWVSEGSDGTVYGVAPGGRVWQYAGSGSLPWTERAGPFSQISVINATTRWAVDVNTNVWKTL